MQLYKYDMAKYERSIKVVIDKSTNKRVEAESLFETYIDGYDIRKLVQTGELELVCCECDQPMNVSTSSRGRLHLKHYPGHNDCILTDLNEKESDIYTRIQTAKESTRHKQLKNLIGEKLKVIDGVDSVAIDDKFIIRGNDKRRPDVYCRYKGKELVFEIQLSRLSLRYINSRYNFYKQQGIYLIWILDQFDVKNQGAMEKDIKYIAPHHNYFKLDEKSENFKLLCDYKEHYLTADNQLRMVWQRVSVSLDQINFDSDFHVFYYDYAGVSEQKKDEQAKREMEIRIEERKKLQDISIKNARSKAKEIISEITRLKKMDYASFEIVNDLIYNLDEFELKILNDELGFNKTDKKSFPVLRWIKETTLANKCFLNFILECEKIEIDINEQSPDGSTAFLEVCKNDKIPNHLVMGKLFERGYILTDGDKARIKDEMLKDQSSSFALYSLYDRLKDRSLVDLAGNYSRQLLIIESAKQKVIIGFNFNDNWVAFANNAIQYHKKFWFMFEAAFSFYGVMKHITDGDHKKTFKAKTDSFYNEIPPQDDTIKPLIEDLYPELFEHL